MPRKWNGYGISIRTCSNSAWARQRTATHLGGSSRRRRTDQETERAIMSAIGGLRTPLNLAPYIKNEPKIDSRW